MIGIGQFARLLLTVVMVAVSQAPSPESNPNSPLPVTGTVVNYTTVNLIGGKFIQHRIRRCFRNIRLPQQWQLPEGVGFCFGELHPATPHRVLPLRVGRSQGFPYRY